MKTNSTYVLVIRIILFILLCLYSFLVFGQPSNSIEESTVTSNTLVFPGKDTVSNLQEFAGFVSEEKTSLRFLLKTNNNVSTVVLEKAHQKNSFQACAEFWINFDGNKETNFQFSDKKNNKAIVYYRLKIIEANGTIQYSNVINFKS